MYIYIYKLKQIFYLFKFSEGLGVCENILRFKVVMLH